MIVLPKAFRREGHDARALPSAHLHHGELHGQQQALFRPHRPVGNQPQAGLLPLGQGVQGLAQLLSRQGEEGVRALALLLALNNSSLQLIPATVMTLRTAAGAADPADIWLPTMLSSLAATGVAAGLMLLINLIRRKR